MMILKKIFRIQKSSKNKWCAEGFVSHAGRVRFAVRKSSFCVAGKNQVSLPDEEGVLQKEVVVSKMEITTQHGAMEDKSQRHNVDFYNLDAIISVGYRVSSPKATKFRQWATKILNEYIKIY